MFARCCASSRATSWGEIVGAVFEPVAGCCAARAAARTKKVAAKVEDIRRAPSHSGQWYSARKEWNASFDYRPLRTRHYSVTSAVPSISRNTPIANGRGPLSSQRERIEGNWVSVRADRSDRRLNGA